MRRALLWISLALALVSFTCSARDMRERREFIKENPQPEKCAKGCEVDHKEALMNGGEDKKKNMQWLTKEEHKEKTKKDHTKKREREGKSPKIKKDHKERAERKGKHASHGSSDPIRVC